MIEITIGVVVAVSVAAFLIGLTKAGLGGGLGPVVTAVMILALPVEVALAIQLPMLLVGDLFSLGAFWRRWSRRHVWRLVAGALPGVLAGTYLLASVQPIVIQRFIGAVGLTFVVYRLAQPHLRRLRVVTPGLGFALVAGTAGGIASTVAHAGSPPVSAYLLLSRVNPVEYTATHILFFAIINVMKVPGYLATGFSYPALQVRLSPMLVFLPVGVLVGRWLVTRVKQATFDRVILGVLTVVGLYLLFVV